MFGEFFFNPFHPTILRYLYEGILGYDLLQWVGIVLPFLFGYSIIQLFAPGLGMKEKAFASFPLGMASVTFLMFLMVLLNIHLSASTLIGTMLIFGIAALSPTILEKKNPLGTGWKERFRKLFQFHRFNLVWLLAFLVILYVLFTIGLKTVFWPTFDSDAVNSFKLFAKAIHAEGTFVNSVLIDESTGKGIPYPPFVPLGMVYFLKFGFVKTKIFFALLLTSFVFAFYAAARRELNRTGAALATFFMAITPEVMAFAALTKTNVIQMIFASLGFIYLFLFLKNRKDGDFFMGTVLLAMNAWTRSEGVEFLFVGGIVLLYYFWKKGVPFKKVLSYGVIGILPFLAWQLFLRANHEYFEHVIQVSLIKVPFWDADKFSTIFSFFKGHMGTTQYYGLGFLAFVAIAILNLLLYFRKQDHVFLVMIFGVLLMHFVLLYQLEYLNNNMVHLLKHSLKRYYFNFIPLIWFYIFCTPFLKTAMKKYEKLMTVGLK